MHEVRGPMVETSHAGDDRQASGRPLRCAPRADLLCSCRILQQQHMLPFELLIPKA